MDHSRLTPYQAEFFRDSVAHYSAGAISVLRAPTGAGQTLAIAAVIENLHRTGRAVRSLILIPPALSMHWTCQLDAVGQSATVIDAKILRLMWQEAGSLRGVWPVGVYVMSIDLAKREDMRDRVAAAGWDLVVMDESHGLRGLRLELVQEIMSVTPSPSMIFATHAQLPSALDFARPVDLADWSAAVDEFRSQQGRTGLLSRKAFEYRWSPEERAIFERVQRLSRNLEPASAASLLRLASSSISCLENVLIRWLSEADRAWEHHTDVEHLLGDLELLGDDTKLKCYLDLLGDLFEGGIRHVAVFCEYRATLDYLAAASVQTAKDIFVLHGGLNSPTRNCAARAFEDAGGLMIMTTVARGSNLDFVGAVIHYDVPFTSGRFSEREASYNRYGRRSPCRVCMLDEASGSSPVKGWAAESVADGADEDISADIEVGETD